ncbi:MAG: T9SS type A sorting domain-containing protein [Bacteroidota bacterium]
MTTLYKNLLMKASMFMGFLFFLLALSYNVKAQTADPNPVCFGGDINFKCAGLDGCDMPGSTYTWTDLAGWSSNDKNPVIHPWESSFYHSGKYYLTVQYTGGGLTSGYVYIQFLDAIIISGVVTPIGCNGGSTGAITIDVSGGSGIYTGYIWSSGQTTKNIAGLSSGTYTVTVSDDAGCSQASAPFTIANTTIIGISSFKKDVTCSGNSNGYINLTVSGGVSPYSYIWSNGHTATGATDGISGLNSGPYTVTVTDGHACTKTETYTITTPSALIITPLITHIKCSGESTGKIDLTVNGGTTAYKYLWSTNVPGGLAQRTTAHIMGLGASTYTVTVTDAHTCIATGIYTITQPASLFGNGVVSNPKCFGGSDGAATISGIGGTPPYYYTWSTGSHEQLITGLSAGRYNVNIADANNCLLLTWEDVIQPSDLSLTGTPVAVSCQGSGNGKITTTVSGGSGGNTTYLWNNSQTGSTATNLTAGTYTVTVTNIAGCSKNKSFTITENPAITIATVAITHAKCSNSNDGSIQLMLAGGVTPYTYLWNNGQTGSTAINLTSGAYTVTITDAGPCTKVGSWRVNAPSALSIAGLITTVLCNGNNDGKIDITVNGGTSNYSYNWNASGAQGQGTPHVSGLFAGTYTVTVTDNNLCTKIQSWYITQPTAMSVSTTIGPLTCYGGSNGIISVSAIGGTPPYTYIWNNGFTTQTINGLNAGRYMVTVTDANYCLNILWMDINQPSDITITGTPVKTTCPGSSNGQISTIVSGGSGGALTFLWNNGQTGSTAINLSVGVYTVTVTNIAGCKASSLPISVGAANLLPGPGGAISGPVFVAPGQSLVAYTTAPIANAGSYIWSLPPGATLAPGSFENNILVNFSNSASSGNMSVSANNVCGDGLPSPNLAVTIVQTNLNLQNISIGPGNACYNAFQTIYVAGGSSTFTVNGGGSATMIAGLNIVYQPGTTVNSGGYMHGYIATNGQYCTTPFNPVVNKSVLTGTLQTTAPEMTKNQTVRIYPNPATGSFTLELTAASGMRKVEIFGMNGIMVLSETLTDEPKHTFSGESLCPGVYIIHVTTGSTNEMVKLVRL